MKKIIKNLFSLLIFFGLGLSFCSAGQYTYSGVSTAGDLVFPVPQTALGTDISIHCNFYCDWGGKGGFYGTVVYAYGNTPIGNSTQFVSNQKFTCKENFVYDYDFSGITSQYGTVHGFYLIKFHNIIYYGNVSYSCVISGSNVLSSSSSSSCPTCPNQYTSEECQTEYSLVPSYDLFICNSDLNSCQSSLSGCQSDFNSCQASLSGRNNTLNNCSNNLLSCQSSLSSCIAGNCPLDDGGVQWSSLFINNIQHIGAPLININIPEEFDWDYSYYTGEFNLDIEGYNTDSDYIAGIINTQNTKPTKEDLNNIVSGVLPLFVPGLVIILFIYFVFRLLKKIF